MIATLTGLRQELQAVEAKPESLTTLLARFHRAGAVRGVLSSVISDVAAAERMAELSYRHPNGFDRIVLVDDGFDRPKARLHMWWPDGSAVREQVHNHAWDFSSVLLAGALRFQLYSLATAGERKLHYQSLPPQRAASGYRLRSLGETSIVCSFDSHLGPGTLYTLDHDALHRVSKSGRSVTATLVIHGPFTRDYSDILADEPLDEDRETRVQHLTAQQLRAKLADLLDVLES